MNKMRPRIPGLALVVLVTMVSASAGFIKQGMPPNASPDGRGGFNCKDGFIKRVRLCVPIAKATDAEIRTLLISRSIESYSGSCPCPYNTDKAGRRCGGRSAYSRPGGAAPLCYASDIKQKSVDDYRGKWKDLDLVQDR